MGAKGGREDGELFCVGLGLMQYTFFLLNLHIKSVFPVPLS
jgi:hypothetical protein